jgi:predicted NAD-dependent protein-ADP-ribosyltransferase YbiA (DUF1768 family)
MKLYSTNLHNIPTSRQSYLEQETQNSLRWVLTHVFVANSLMAVQDSDKDAFWGVGADGQGRNELGKCLERLRATLLGNRR